MNVRRRLLPALLVLLALGAGCGRKPKVTLPPPRPAVVGATETGIASWYGHPYHGRRTANGEVYDMNEITAAHLSLPFGAWLRVTNLDNGREVDVRINDRGPFVKGRVIDLSRAAAQRIAMLGPGTAKVRLKVISRAQAAPQRARKEVPALPPERPRTPTAPAVSHEPAPIASGVASGNGEPPCAPGPYYGVQVGSFREIENAERLQDKMDGRYGDTQIIHKSSAEGDLYRVVVGPASDHAEATRWQQRFAQDRIPGFVTLIAESYSSNCL